MLTQKQATKIVKLFNACQEASLNLGIAKATVIEKRDTDRATKAVARLLAYINSITRGGLA